jgi:hypothetical protein
MHVRWNSKKYHAYEMELFITKIIKISGHVII